MIFQHFMRAIVMSTETIPLYNGYTYATEAAGMEPFAASSLCRTLGQEITPRSSSSRLFLLEVLPPWKFRIIGSCFVRSNILKTAFRWRSPQ